MLSLPNVTASAAPVVFTLDDNLVLADETLGRLWAPQLEAWPQVRPVNDNRVFRRVSARTR